MQVLTFHKNILGDKVGLGCNIVPGFDPDSHPHKIFFLFLVCVKYYTAIAPFLYRTISKLPINGYICDCFEWILEFHLKPSRNVYCNFFLV